MLAGRSARHCERLSRHANYELAEEVGSPDAFDPGSCARCHTGNGFLAWLPVLLGEEEGDGSKVGDHT
jgi:hypothetical protein